jgi:GxxExxY protein
MPNGERDARTHAVIGAAMRVHTDMGNGYLENIYHDALEVEFQGRCIPFRREAALRVQYRGRPLGHPYFADFICFEDILVEIKAQRDLGEADLNQVVHYLKGTGLKTGLLLNFGERRLQFQRFIYDERWHSDPIPSESSETSGGNEAAANKPPPSPEPSSTRNRSETQ